MKKFKEWYHDFKAWWFDTMDYGLGEGVVTEKDWRIDIGFVIAGVVGVIATTVMVIVKIVKKVKGKA